MGILESLPPKKAQDRFGIGLGQVERGGCGLENSRERTHEMVCLVGLLLERVGLVEEGLRGIERVRFVC